MSSTGTVGEQFSDLDRRIGDERREFDREGRVPSADALQRRICNPADRSDLGVGRGKHARDRPELRQQVFDAARASVRTAGNVVGGVADHREVVADLFGTDAELLDAASRADELAIDQHAHERRQERVQVLIPREDVHRFGRLRCKRRDQIVGLAVVDAEHGNAWRLFQLADDLA